MGGWVWFDKLEIKPTQPCLAGAWLSLATKFWSPKIWGKIFLYPKYSLVSRNYGSKKCLVFPGIEDIGFTLRDVVGMFYHVQIGRAFLMSKLHEG